MKFLPAHMKRLFFIPLLIIVIASSGAAQDLTYVRSCIDSLASPGFHGRGYVYNGDKIAATFIAGQLKSTGLKHWGDNYFQEFPIDINSFSGKIELSVDKTKLLPGKDYFVSLSSPSVSGTYKTLWLGSQSLNTEVDKKAFAQKKLNKTALILDTGFKDMKNPLIYRARVILKTTTKTLTWAVADGTELTPYTMINVSREKVPLNCKKATLRIESSFLKQYKTQNVAGYIPGSAYPDSFFVFIAHYDHLGRMGADTYFPGAHDNASGTAMLLDLARYYSMPEHRPLYSVAFIFMSGEEAGLLGSSYYTNHPLFPLRQIKFLMNLDMESTGSEGIKVVNGSVLKEYFDKLVKLNDEGQFLKTVSPRGEAANSDHYWFYKKGVPCFYIYTLGDEWKQYHTPGDVSTGLPMTKYNELFKLVTVFIGKLANPEP
jgi:aminopeptidase YwaD